MDAHYGKIKTTILGLAIAACYASSAHATIIYDGSTSVIQTPVNEDIRVTNQAVVNVNSGGVVHGSTWTTVDMNGGVLNVRGNGQIIADPGQIAINTLGGGRSDIILRDQASVTGNIEQGFTIPGWENESTAQTRLYLQDQAVVNGNLRYAGYVRLQDQAHITGGILTPAWGNTRLDMQGGVVDGALSMSGYQEYIINLSGGSILGGVRGNEGLVAFNMTGGYIGDGMRTSSRINANISGGQVDGGFAIETSNRATSHLTITGGQFDAAADDYLFYLSNYDYHNPTTGPAATLDISGGQWGYNEQGLGFLFDHLVNFSISGWDLTFTDGLLSGYLLDGSWFSNQFSFGSNWQGTFTINNTTPNVPEPGTLGLLAACLIGTVVARRRRA